MWGCRYDTFELVTLALRVIVAEDTNAFSEINNHPASGVLLRGVLFAALPILIYGFSGVLKVGRNSSKFI